MPSSKGTVKDEKKMMDVAKKDKKRKKEPENDGKVMSLINPLPKIIKKEIKEAKDDKVMSLINPLSKIIKKEIKEEQDDNVMSLINPPSKIIKQEIKEETIISNYVQLMSSDGAVFEVEAAAAKHMQAISGLVGDISIVRLHDLKGLDNLTGDVLAMVIQYCKKHTLPSETTSSSAAATADEISEKMEAWDNYLMKDCDLRTLWDLKTAAQYLKVEGLVNLTSKVINSIIVGKTATEIRSLLELKGDPTDEEEAAISKFDKWVF